LCAVLPMTGLDRRLTMSRPLTVAALLLAKLWVSGNAGSLRMPPPYEALLAQSVPAREGHHVRLW
jgi:hypothetical protein